MTLLDFVSQFVNMIFGPNIAFGLRDNVNSFWCSKVTSLPSSSYEHNFLGMLQSSGSLVFDLLDRFF